MPPVPGRPSSLRFQSRRPPYRAQSLPAAYLEWSFGRPSLCTRARVDVGSPRLRQRADATPPSRRPVKAMVDASRPDSCHPASAGVGPKLSPRWRTAHRDCLPTPPGTLPRAVRYESAWHPMLYAFLWRSPSSSRLERGEASRASRDDASVGHGESGGPIPADWRTYGSCRRRCDSRPVAHVERRARSGPLGPGGNVTGGDAGRAARPAGATSRARRPALPEALARTCVTFAARPAVWRASRRPPRR